MIAINRNINRYIIFAFSLVLFSCTSVVIKVEGVPPNTPLGDQIFVAGNFNYWDSGDVNFALQMQQDSSYIIKLPKTFGKVAYKFTRGNWSTVEKNLCGNEINDRVVVDRNVDTIYHIIESWADLDPVNCDSVTIVIDKLPDNIDKKGEVKIAGTFNAWNPGEKSEYVAKLDSITNRLQVTIPRRAMEGKTSSILQYKFVHDNVDNTEVDRFGREMDARILNFEKGDTVFVEIENWKDDAVPEYNKVTIVLTKIPKNTPVEDDIFLVGNFNDWVINDLKYIFKKQNNGNYIVSLPRDKWGLSFKITRGSWDKEFTDGCGNKLDDQNYNYDEIDTLYYAIDGWMDIRPKVNKQVTFVVKNVPENTPGNEELYLKSFMGPYNYEASQYPFVKKEDGLYYITLPRKKVNDQILISRKGTVSQQVLEDGSYIVSQTIRDRDLCADTVFIDVEQWNDLTFLNESKITIELKKIPKSTPMDELIYLTGRFNAWHPADSNFILKKNTAGSYAITVPLRYLGGGFKFTRGNWQTVEGDTFDNFIGDRYYTGNAKKLELEIKGWEN